MFNLPLEEGAWRALLLCIKAKLESMASNIAMPDNRTVYEHTAPRIAQIAKGGEMQPLLPGPKGSH